MDLILLPSPQSLLSLDLLLTPSSSKLNDFSFVSFSCSFVAAFLLYFFNILFRFSIVYVSSADVSVYCFSCLKGCLVSVFLFVCLCRTFVLFGF